MIYFFETSGQKLIYAVEAQQLLAEDIEKLTWLFAEAEYIKKESLGGFFRTPRKEMITPWSTNAVEITRNMGIEAITRIEAFTKVSGMDASFDPMLQVIIENPGQDVFKINHQPEPIAEIDDIGAYNESEGLALSLEEIQYLENVSQKLGRKLTDSEIFGFSQVNSEHCRHKIFNGTFVIDGEEMTLSLFEMIKLTTKNNPNRVISAYKDNCAFFQGPLAEQFAPGSSDKPDYFKVKDIETVLSLKAETHNFPTTVEPFNGAATGSGGEIRDRVGGGKGAIPLAGTAVYMTAYPRTEPNRPWEKDIPARKWLYQTPEDILIKASNGASDFGNKFGQPLICGSLQTFEHEEGDKRFGFDKVIMLAGGIGFGKKADSLKDSPQKGDKVVLLGGDNYRIGMGGGAVSSVATGEFANAIELNAVQRSNPEMQKRAVNAIRALSEMDENPVVSIHDHGAGGHLNCLSELVEETGGEIDLSKLPVGDPTLTARELVGNESQERMGLVMKKKDIDLLKRIAARERAPFYVIGEATGDMQFTFVDKHSGKKPIDLQLAYLFGSPPKTVLTDKRELVIYKEVLYKQEGLDEYLNNVLQLESVACKDWLTNKVDRSVTGKVALQQTTGTIQLPLNDMAITAVDYQGKQGVATAIGHSPLVSLINPEHGSVMAISEALTNIVWAPIEGGLKGVSLSANWMWPAKNKGENARLYDAVKAASDFAVGLGINIPTGKDSLSMTQKYPDGKVVYSPGTVIISAGAEIKDIRKAVTADIKPKDGTQLVYIAFSRDTYHLGGSSLGQSMNRLGMLTSTVKQPSYFMAAFAAVQELVERELLLAGHDISAGGIIVTLLEMLFPHNNTGLRANLEKFKCEDTVRLLFSEKPGVVIQVSDLEKVTAILDKTGAEYLHFGEVSLKREMKLTHMGEKYSFNIDKLRDTWYKSSYLLDRKQSGEKLAKARYGNYKKQDLQFKFPQKFSGTFAEYGIDPKRRTAGGIKAAIIREKGINGDREMAWIMYLAGFDVKDVHMTDLIEGRETLEDIQLIVFTGGFSNSDVLGSAKGWAGAFRYNKKAKQALENFYAREDTLSLGVCNGCQLMMELDLIMKPEGKRPFMSHNDSGKFESAFLNVEISPNKSVMLETLAGSRLGIWIAHGEGKFNLPENEESYHIPMKYSYKAYPGNPNGSSFDTAAVCSADGRHLAMMPHLERSTYPWNWAQYPDERKKDEVTPWVEAFVNARKWLERK